MAATTTSSRSSLMRQGSVASAHWGCRDARASRRRRRRSSLTTSSGQVATPLPRRRLLPPTTSGAWRRGDRQQWQGRRARSRTDGSCLFACCIGRDPMLVTRTVDRGASLNREMDWLVRLSCGLVPACRSCVFLFATSDFGCALAVALARPSTERPDPDTGAMGEWPKNVEKK